MKTSICFILLFLSGIHLLADDGHNLWLRNKSTGHVNVISTGSSATMTIAIDELQKGWQGKDGAKVVLTVKNDIITPTINLDNPDPLCDLDYVPHKAKQKTVNFAISNSFGFGGHNATVAVKKYIG